MRRKIITYNPKLVPLARKLRLNSTLSEILLWQQLKKKQQLGYDFDRQRPIGNYIVDFYCKELGLALEIDGCSHSDKEDYDLKRQRELEELGVMILRFDDRDVKKELDAVLREIRRNIKELERDRG
jgi:very-short-patch-repair endonuclease